jgi:hypothetical protein
MFNIKSDNGLSEVGYDRIVEWTRNILPVGNKLKENFYAAKSMMKPLGLGYQKISVSSMLCMLYYFENTELTEWRTCGHSCYKSCLVGKGLLSHTKNLNTFQSHLDYKVYSCNQRLMSI